MKEPVVGPDGGKGGGPGEMGNQGGASFWAERKISGSTVSKPITDGSAKAAECSAYVATFNSSALPGKPSG